MKKILLMIGIMLFASIQPAQSTSICEIEGGSDQTSLVLKNTTDESQTQPFQDRLIRVLAPSFVSNFDGEAIAFLLNLRSNKNEIYNVQYENIPKIIKRYISEDEYREQIVDKYKFWAERLNFIL